MLCYEDITDYLKNTGMYNLDTANQLLCYNWDIEFDGSRIKITIPDILPSVYIKTNNTAAAYFANNWKQDIALLIKSLNLNEVYSEVLVWIKIYNKGLFDIDNKFFKPIIDGVSLSGIIKDDNANYFIKMGVEGHIISGENPYTEVFIFGNNNIPEITIK